MGSKGGKAKQQIAAYQMSLHLGFCYSVDKLLELFVKEKSVWKGLQSTNTEITINQQNLFGGPKKEGGLWGAVSVLQGRSDQVMPTHLTTRLGRTPSNSPGFRDILSLFFYGAPGQGFLWSHNYPYIHTIWVRVQRIFQSGWYSAKAAIPSGYSIDVGSDLPENETYPVNTEWAYHVTTPSDTTDYSNPETSGWDTAIGPFGDRPHPFVDSGFPAPNTYVPVATSVVIVKTVYCTVGRTVRIRIKHDNNIYAWWNGVPLSLVSEGTWTSHVDIPVTQSENVISLRCIDSGDTSLGNYIYLGATITELAEVMSSVAILDMNPAHIIRECLTNVDWGMALPVAMIDDAAFEAAADTLYDEQFGLSMIWTGQSEIETFVNEVLGHIDGTYGIDPETGKLYIKLVRGGYDIDSLPELNEDNCRITQFNRKALGETTNEIVVTWTNPANEGEETVVVHDLANYSAQGVLISSSRNYYGIRSSALAIRVAMRELGKASQPIATFEVEANRVAWKWKSGDVIKVTYPEYGLVHLPCRITNIGYGKPGEMAIKITLIEDVFEMPDSSYAVSEGSLWEPPAPIVNTVNDTKIITAPYSLIARRLGESEAAAVSYPDAFPMILAVGTGGSAEVYAPTTDSVGGVSYAYLRSVPFSGKAVLDVPLTKSVTSSGVSVIDLTGSVAPASGIFAMVGPDPETGEIVVVESGDASAMVIRRGMLDTVPDDWPIGTPIWFYNWDDDLSDGQTSISGSSVTYRVAPQSSSGEGFLSASVTFSSRHYRPYRPANVRINGVRWPAETVGDLVVAWSHRNRFMENSVPLLWDSASVFPEDGTTYSIEITDESSTVLYSSTGISLSTVTVPSMYLTEGVLRLRLWSVRGALPSWKVFEHMFAWGDVRLTESGEIRITESGEPRFTD